MSESRRICLVTRDIIGPIKNGGIGTAFHNLACFLAANGHQVTILYTLGEHTENEPLAHWVDYYQKRKITFTPLVLDEATSPVASHAMRTSLCVYRWLKQQTFDVVHFHEWCGVGYYSLIAKMEGLAFEATRLCVQMHSPTVWHLVHNASLITSFDIVELDVMERRSAELADVLICPSRYLVEWCRSQGWKLPADVQVIHNLLAPDWYENTLFLAKKGQDDSLSLLRERKPVKELVFFGRLEWRKGLILFCQALQRVAPELRQKITVSFLGKESNVMGLPARRCIEKAMEHMKDVSWQVIDNKDSAGAREYLKGEGRVAVVASLVENSPYTVLECLAEGIPLLASDTGGTPELIAAEDRGSVCFSPEPATLAERLRQVIENGLAPAHPAEEWARTRNDWLALHAAPIKVAEKRTSDAQPLVSICVTHFNRPAMLQETLEGIAAQNYAKLEVIVVDDGSTDAAAVQGFRDLERKYSDRGWIFLTQTNRYLGAARNHAAKHATGEYLLFMDDDNYAKPDEVTQFVNVAMRTGADILTCAVEYFTDDAERKDKSRTPKIQIPLGSSLSGGIYENMFGDANALIRTSMFRALGGFTEMYGVGLEDFEFFAKAVAKGYRLEVIPEPLFFYRQNAQGMLQNTGRIQNALRAIRPYVEKYPEISSGLLLAQGYHHQVPELATNCVRALEELKSVLQERDKLHVYAQSLEKEVERLNQKLAVVGDEFFYLISKFRQRPILNKLLNFKVWMMLRLIRLRGRIRGS